MRNRVAVAVKVDADADRIWSEIAKVEGWERWIDILTGSQVSGADVLSSRVCHTGDGDIHETVETLDPDLRLFQYTIQSAPMPMRNALGTLHVRPIGDGRSEVRWSLNFDASEEAAAQLKPMIEGIYNDSIRTLAEIARTN